MIQAHPTQVTTMDRIHNRTQAVVLTSATGLVGHPEVGSRGSVKVTSLLTPDLSPDRSVLLVSQRVRGQYVVREVRYKGDSHANDWFAECLLVPAEAA